MAVYTTPTDIANRALQACGANLIGTLNDTSRNAVQANFLYDKIRVAQLRAHVWNFAIKYQTLLSPATIVTYQNGMKRNAFTIPADFHRLAIQTPRTAGNATQVVSAGVRFTDYSVEGPYLVTSLPGPILLRYVGDIVTVSSMDPLFCEAVAFSMAENLMETLTNNFQKKQLVIQEYNEAIAVAKAINLIEAASDEPPEQDFHQDRLLREKLPPPPRQAPVR